MVQGLGKIRVSHDEFSVEVSKSEEGADLLQGFRNVSRRAKAHFSGFRNRSWCLSFFRTFRVRCSLRSFEFIEEVGDARERVSIFDGSFVELLIVLAGTERPIFLCDEEEGGGLGR
jgi:hypothetical protein